MPLGTYRNGCAVATPYAVQRQPLATFMAQIGAYTEAALRVRKTCMLGCMLQAGSMRAASHACEASEFGSMIS